MPHANTAVTTRLATARAATKRALQRELLYAGILARLWSSYLVLPKPERKDNQEFPCILCVDSPAGKLLWRLSPDELVQFEWLGTPLENHGEYVDDRTPVLLHLAAEGWR